jgi:YidC/Oxa1 family membrane protein insertase
MTEFFSFILYYPFLNLLTFFIWVTPGHYAAVGVILLTLFVRLLLLIPSKRAAQGQRKLSQLQPLMKELKNDYKGDQAGLAAAQMELYKKNGVNPFSSCGLLLIQLPILYILYHTIVHGLTPNNPHLYEWIPRPEFINTDFFGINLLSPDQTFVLPILAAVLQYFQTRMTLPPPAPGTEVDPQVTVQRNMMYFFPLFTLFFASRFPAGAALYWVVTTLFSVIQQYFVNKERYTLKGVEKVVDNAEKAHPEATARLERVEAEVLDKKVGKGGVSLTVRKKNKK